MGLDGLLRSRAAVLIGIVNGIDDEVWDPATDSHLPGPFSRQDLGRRAANKAALRARFGSGARGWGRSSAWSAG